MNNIKSILFLYSFSSLLIFISPVFSQEKNKVRELFRLSVTSLSFNPEILSQNKSINLNNEILKNSIYTIDNTEIEPQEFHLKNGRAEFRYGTGATQKIIVQILDPWIRYGDLNDDQSPDAIAILTYDSGGSGTYIYLATMLNQEGQAVNVATEFLGDRIKIHDLSIEDNKIFLTFSERNSQEKISYKITLQAGKLVKEKIGNTILDKINFDISKISPEALIDDSNSRGLALPNP
ncbi:MAG: hypothetical protein AB4372_27180, partial [Xenococcus sp. (in: cyanobacteria)]